MPPLRRLLFSVLTLLCAGLEGAAALFADQARRVELPAAQHNNPLPNRAEGGVGGGPTLLCVGDSWTYGVGVRPEESFPAQLSALLPKEPPTKVINLGEPGATPLRAARLLTQWMRLNTPARIFLLIGTNPDPVESDAVGATANPLLRLRPLLRHLASYKLLVQVVARAQVRSESLLADERYAQRGNFVRTPGAEGSVPAELERCYAQRLRDVHDNLVRIDALASAADAQLVLLTYAVPVGEPEPPRAGHRDANRALRATARALGRPLIELEDLYTRHGLDADLALNDPRREPGQPYSDLHPNARGYSLYAQEIAAWLAENP